MRIAAAGASAVVVLVTGVAGAQEAPFAFGSPGQVAISAEFGAETGIQTGIHAQANPDGPNPPTTSRFVLAPAADVFVLQNFSVGGQVTLSWEKTGDRHVTAFGVGPRVGYDVPIADKFSFWPKGGLVFAASGNQDTTRTSVATVVYAPFLFHPVQHFFVGLGPSFTMELLARSGGRAVNRSIDFYLTSVVGGWF